MKIYKIFAFLLIGLALSHSSYAQFPLEIQVTIAPPYPTKLSAFSDYETRIFIDITNTTNEDYNVIFVGNLTNEDRGIQIETDLNNLPTNCIFIEPGLNRLTGADLGDLFNPDYLKITGASAEQIRGDQALPEGNYTLCLRAFDCFIPGKALSPFPDIMMGCADFEVAYIDPPEIISPECGISISNDIPSITFNWLFIPPATGYGDIRFKLRIVEIDPPGLDPFDVMNSATDPYLFESEDIFTNSFNLFPNADVLFIEGKSYAFNVIAFDPSEEIQFRNGGQSEACSFTYSSANDSELEFIASYPRAGDYIPFDFFPFVLKFTPYSDNYLIFEGDFDLLEKSGSRFTALDNKHSRNRWPRGPLTTQRNLGFAEMTEEQSQHLPVYKNASEAFERLRKGVEYAWQFSGEMELQDGSLLIAETDRVEFNIGMSPPKLEQPADGSTKAPGMINFQWTSAEKPSSLVPPFDITQFSGGSPVNFFNGSIDESWVLEVSDTIAFDSIIYSDNGRIQGLELTSAADTTVLIQALYKQLNSEKSFTETGTYYWRVKWLDNPEDLSSEAYSTSPTWQFTIGTPEVAAEEEPEGCVSVCLSPEITDTEAVEISSGQTLRIGKFNLQIASLTSTGTNQYDGEGEIIIPFLNNIRISVEFKNIKANTAKQIFSGKATAKDDEPHITADSIATIVNGIPVSVPSLSTAESDALSEVFETGERLISALGGSRPMGMPLGLDNEIDGTRFIIAITEMEFESRKASLTAMAQIDIPDLGNKIPAFGARNVCITPTGFGDEYVLYLARDHQLFSDGDLEFAFNGIESGDSTRASYIEFNCTGLKCISLRGTVTFPNDKLIPENDDGTIDEEGNVTGTFAFKSCRGGNYLAELSFSAFQVKGMNGWGFKPITAYLDLSDLENPPDFTLPENYRDPDLSEEGETSIDPRLVNTWKGFYLKEVTLRAPPDFEDDVMGRAEFSISNLIIDKTGLTAAIEVRNMIDIDNGNVKGWSFALDTVSIGIVQNSNITGRLSGKIGMPIFDENDYLLYRGLISYSDSTMGINFRVNVDDTLDIPMWGQANMFFADNSKIEFNYSSTGLTHLTAELHGGIDIEGDIEGAVSAIPGIKFKGIRFEGLRLSTAAPKFNVDSLYFAHASPQKSAGGFPVNIHDIGINLASIDRPGIEFNIGLTLSNAGFSADAGFTIFGQLNLLDGKDRFTYGGLQLDEIRIEQTISGVSLLGELEFYQEDPTYGKGMRGYIKVTMPMDLTAEMTVMFGTKKSRDDALFNTRDYYSYWFVDGLITIPGGVPIFSGFGVYGFGGGVYHHMRRASEPPPAAASLTAGTSGARSGIRYVPDYENLLGLKITAVIGTQPSNEAFNMDVTLEATFSSSGGVSYIGIRGEGYIMASISERENAKVQANIEIAYHNDSEGGERVSGSFDVFVRFGDYLKGGGENDLFVHAAMHVDSEQWYFYMGTPDARSELTAALGPLSLNLNSYLMVGYGIPSVLPPLPPDITALIYGPGQDRLAGGSVTTDQVEGRVQLPGVSTRLEGGRGFAFGTALDFDTGKLRFAIFYARLRLMLGFDINFTSDSSRVCDNTGVAPGINDWYATGQVYAGLWGELGVGVDLWFIKGDFPIVELSAAIMMRGGLPNPAWFEGRAGLQYRILGGMIEGYCNFSIEVGQKCSPVSDNPFADIDFIGEFNPADNETDVNVFIYPQISFNLPINKVLVFPAGTDEQPDKIRIFRPFIYRFRLEKKNSNLLIPGRVRMEENNVIARYEIVEALESHQDYDLIIEVRAYEYFPDGTNRLITTNNTPWREIKTSKFRTGLRPEVIDPDNVSYTYPFQDQVYFLQEESENGKGLLRYFGPTQDYLFAPEIDGKNYSYKARFIPLGEGNPVETRLYPRLPNRIEFALPELTNSTYYGMQIIREYIVPRDEQLASQLNRGLVESSSVRLAPIRRRLALSGTLKINLEAKKLPAEYAQPSEKILYKYYFRTSKYNNLAEKLASVNFNPTYNYGYVYFENVKLKAQIPEQFDEFEINGIYKRGVRVLPPLFEMSAPFRYSYHNQIANPSLYSLHRSVRSIRRGLPVAPLNTHRKGNPPEYTVNLASNTPVAPRVGDWEYRKAAGIEEPTVPTTVTKSRSKLVPSGISKMMNNSSVSNVGTVSFAGINFSGSASESSFRFNLEYTTSAFVKTDFIRFKQIMSRILSNTTYRSTLQRNTSSTIYHQSNAILLYPVTYFNYRRGNYGVTLRYRHPSGRVSSPSSAVTKTFFLNLSQDGLY